MDTAQDPRPLYQLALDQLEKLFSEAGPEKLDRPTPCTEYDLRALLDHVVGGVHRLAYTGEGGLSNDVAAATGGVPDDGWPAALGRARARVTTAWAEDAKLDRPTSVPWGELSGREAVGSYVLETVIHSWDVARALGTDHTLDEALGEAALAIALAMMPAEPRGGAVPFGPVQPVPAGAGAYTRLAAHSGRTV
ncbi:TIGR03086 family metal-binding protein [Kitasatospora sp. NPDC008115]|uniref:TIGR03086 family metal-binding protein n=1 Tax=Kitasatospora sp. NPDC008115 TaxID=3364022 RepID=UPI0036E224F1